MPYFSFERTDNEIIRVAQISNFLLVTMIFLVEHGLISSPDEASVFLILANKNPTDGEQGLPITTTLLVIFAILSICVLQYRIEKRGLEEISTNKQIIRVIVIIVVIVVGYIPKFLEIVDFSSRVPLFYMLNGVLISIFFGVLPPTLFLASNLRLKKYACLQIKSILPRCLSKPSKISPMYDVIV